MGRAERSEAPERVLARLNRPAAPDDGFARALEVRLLAEFGEAPAVAASRRSWEGPTPSLELAPPPDGSAPGRPLPAASSAIGGRRWSPLAEVGTAALLLLTLLSTYFAARVAAPDRDQRERPFAVYAQDDGGLRRLDPMTLMDLPPPGPIGAVSPGPADGRTGESEPTVTWLASADGSTFVRIEDRVAANVEPDATGDRVVPPGAASELTISVLNGPNGPERARFPSPIWPATARLSADGRRLVVRELEWSVAGEAKASAWHVLDTADGRVLATVRGEEPTLLEEIEAGNWRGWEIDAAARRLYRLVTATDGGDELAPTTLVAYDLATGAETGRLDLPALRAGIGHRAGTPAVGGATERPRIQRLLGPALAVSPDGKQLAIVHGDGSAVTLIDAARMAVNRTLPITPGAATMPVDEIVEPATENRANEDGPVSGTVWRATYAPDGRHLYLSGIGGDATAGGGEILRNFALQRVDLTTGSVLAKAAVGWNVSVVPSPDGRNLYVVGLQPPPAGEADAYRVAEIVVQRLDAATLATLAGPRTELDGPVLVVEEPRRG